MPRFRSIMRGLLGGLFVLAGANHFRRPDLYLSIMPPYLPWHAALVALSGYAEIVLGALVFVPKLIGVARWGLVALLIAVFPANLHMALHPERFARIPPLLLWLRLPLQLVLIAWVLWAARRSVPETPAPHRSSSDHPAPLG